MSALVCASERAPVGSHRAFLFIPKAAPRRRRSEIDKSEASSAHDKPKPVSATMNRADRRHLLLARQGPGREPHEPENSQQVRRLVSSLASATLAIVCIFNLSAQAARASGPELPELGLLPEQAFEHQRQPQVVATGPQYFAPAYSHGACLLSLNRTASYSGTWPAYVQQQQQQQQQTVCITERDVSWALEEAKRQLASGRSSVPATSALAAATSDTPKPIELIELANLITQASHLLAQRFQLSPAEILFELPMIDASSSPALAATCPALLRPDQQQCLADDQPLGEATRFRSLSGFCNNPRERSWGSARSAMVRFLAPDYQDSLHAPRVARDGSPLPAARVVSFVVHQDRAECEPRHSLLGVVWGQFINHDINLGVRITDEDEQLKDLDCCQATAAAQTGSGPAQHRDCFPIEIPKGDPFYGYFGHKCMNFVRLAGSLQPGCSLGPLQAMNKHSSYLDGSSIYGSSAATLKRLRTFRGGQLRSQPAVSPTPMPTLDYDYSLASTAGPFGPLAGPTATPLFKDLLPAQTAAPDAGCERRGRPRDLFCFDAGDSRANEQIQLASLHTIFMREHNRLAARLAALNPHWSDERLFEEARAIVVAELQHITYAEFLPLVLGSRNLRALNLELEPTGCHFRGYDDKINAGVRVEFQSAAFRFGHSLVPGHIERYNKFHQPIESVRLSKLLKQPFDLYHPGVLDTYLLGMVDQRSGRMDSTLTSEVANHLFERPGQLFGMDLAAINIQRAREMGVRGYNSYREYCGLPRARSFNDLMGVFTNKTLLRVAQLYRHVDDIDLFTGGLAERPLAPSAAATHGDEPAPLVGPTFACLIGRQFEALRRGDRFWYENAGHFRLDQLDEIRLASSAARLLCDNSDDIEDLQARAMLMAEPRTNPRLPCASLPSLDLSRWREHAPGGQAPAAAAAPILVPDDGELGAAYKRALQQGNGVTPQPAVRMPLDYEEDTPLLSDTIGMSHFVNHLVAALNFQPAAQSDGQTSLEPGASSFSLDKAARRSSRA